MSAGGTGNGHAKTKRQQAMLGLVARERLGSQGEIGARLSDLGIDATQSTISRDIEELGLARVHDRDGMRYVVPGNGRAPVGPLRRLLEEFALSLVRTDAGLLVRTPPGTNAGDDTILILGWEGVRASRLEATITEITEGATG